MEIFAKRQISIAATASGQRKDQSGIFHGDKKIVSIH